MGMNIYRKWRKMAGLSQKEVGEILGIKPQTVQKWEYEKEKSRPPAAYWGKLAELYQIPKEYFLEAEGGVEPEPPGEGVAMVLQPQEKELIELIRDYGGRKVLEGLIDQLRKRATDSKITI